jgi:hypothetical protein
MPCNTATTNESHIKALDQRVECVGKRVASSKVKVTWGFNVLQERGASCFTVQLLDSKSSGKKRVTINEEAADVNVGAGKNAGQIAFEKDGITFTIILGKKNKADTPRPKNLKRKDEETPEPKIDNGKSKDKPPADNNKVDLGYDLLIDGHSFTKLHLAMLDKTHTELTQLRQSMLDRKSVGASTEGIEILPRTSKSRKSDLRNSSGRMSHSNRRSMDLEASEAGLNENQMHTSRYSANSQKVKKRASKSSKKRGSKKASEDIAGLETLCACDDFFMTESSRASASSVASSAYSSFGSSSTQFNSELSEFDSAVDYFNSPPTTAKDSSSTSATLVTECAISPVKRISTAPAIAPAGLASVPVPVPVSVYVAAPVAPTDMEILQKLQAENAMLKQQYQQQYHHQQQQQFQPPQFQQQQITPHHQQTSAMPTLISRVSNIDFPSLNRLDTSLDARKYGNPALNAFGQKTSQTSFDEFGFTNVLKLHRMSSGTPVVSQP